MDGNIKVAVRIRPLEERDPKETEVIWLKKSNSIYLKDKAETCFTFDHVFDMTSTNLNVFEEKVKPIIDGALHGYNGTVFAYGQTASGKTYTMMGTDENPGVIIEAIHYIYQCIENTPERTYLLRMSCMELYNENFTDLLYNSEAPLKITEDKNGLFFVPGLKEEVVKNVEETCQRLHEGRKRCHVAGTTANDRSSRSHIIFRIVIESQPTYGGEDEDIVISQLNLVDLAGSEKASQVNFLSQHFKEGRSINLSLLALTQVISKLSEGKNSFINFRVSNLTKILKTSLGGNAQTTVICNVKPTVYDETLSTLKFAERAKQVKNKPKINSILSKDSLLKKYEKEINNLREKLEKEESRRCENLQKQLEVKDNHISQLKENLRSLQEKLLVSSHAVTMKLPSEKPWNHGKKRCTSCTESATFSTSCRSSGSLGGVFCKNLNYDNSTLSSAAPELIEIGTMTELMSEDILQYDQQNDLIKSKCDELSRKMAEIASLQDQLKEKDRLVEEATLKVQLKIEENICMEKKIHEFSSKIDLLHGKLEEVVDRNVELVHKNEDLVGTVSAMNTQLEGAVKLESEILSLNEKIALMEKEDIDMKETHISELHIKEKNIDEISAKLQKQLEGTANLESEIRSLHEKIAVMEKQEIDIKEKHKSELHIKEKHCQEISSKLQAQIKSYKAKEKYEKERNDMKDDVLEHMDKGMVAMWEDERKKHSITRLELYDVQIESDLKIKKLTDRIEELEMLVNNMKVVILKPKGKKMK